MGIFDEYLDDWDFGDRWRPVGEHLAALASRWPLPDLPADDFFTIWDGARRGAGPAGGVLIWLDLVPRDEPRRVGVTLGALIDEGGLWCGPICSQRLMAHSHPDDSDDFSLPAAGHSLEHLTDEALAWFGRMHEAWVTDDAVDADHGSVRQGGLRRGWGSRVFRGRAN